MSTQQTEALPALIERFRGLHFDHAPDGWPAVRTREITALLDRITELESQLAQRFDAADMATASAQGFRDGVASLSANAGEPRNAIDRDALIDAIAQGLHGTWHCTRVWEAWHVGTMSQDDFAPVDESETPTEIADAVLALLAAQPAAQAAGWISVDERLPEVGVTVLVYEPFRHGEDWPGTVRILFDYICPDYEDWHDHCASHEHFMAVGGANACGPDVTCTGPSEKAPYTHWIPLPPDPGPADGESNG